MEQISPKTPWLCMNCHLWYVKTSMAFGLGGTLVQQLDDTGKRFGGENGVSPCQDRMVEGV